VLLKEFGEDHVEYLFGFFDIAYDIDDSRDTCMGLYRALVVPQRDRKRAVASREDRLDVLKGEMLKVIELEIGPDDDTTDDDRADNFRNKVIEAANLCERAWVLIEQKAIDAGFFFADQAYNVASSYYALEPILSDLCKEERFNFDDYRNIAVAAQKYIRKHGGYDPRIANATFSPLPDYEAANSTGAGEHPNP